MWLDAQKTDLQDFYQFWIRTDDRDVIKFLKYFTFLDRKKIEELERKHAENPQKREAHQVLAEAMCKLARPNQGGAYFAKAATAILYDKAIGEISKEDLMVIYSDVAHAGYPVDAFNAGVSLVDALVATGLCSSKSDARREIEKGGVYINKERQVKDVAYNLQSSDLLHDKYVLLRRGKRDYGIMRTE